MAREGRLSQTLLLLVALLPILGGFAVRAVLIRRAEEKIARQRLELAFALACEVEPPPAPLEPHPWGRDNGWDLLHPAIDALAEVRTTYVDPITVPLDVRPEYGLHGDPTLLLTPFQSSLDACRRAAASPRFDWKGPLDRNLGWKGCAASLHLSTMAFLAWDQGRDADAVDWLIAALTLAQESARFDQPHADEQLKLVEMWAYDGCRLLLSRNGLSAPQLEDFESRLDRLRSRRPRSTRLLRWYDANIRSAIIEIPEQTCANLRPGWRELWSRPLNIARVLDGLRDAESLAESRTWASSLQLEDQWKACCLASFGDDVRWFWFDSHWYWQELGAFYRWDFVRVAVGVARFRAAKGRMPVTLDEAGVAEILSRPVTIKSDRIAAKLCPEGPDVSSFARQLDQVEWVIRPR